MIPQLQFLAKMIDDPVVRVVQVSSCRSHARGVQRHVPLLRSAVVEFSRSSSKPVVAQRQIPMVPSVQQTIEISLLQSIDKVVYVLVVQVVQVSQVPVVEKTGGSHSCSSSRNLFRSRRFLDKVVACPLVCNNRYLS